MRRSIGRPRQNVAGPRKLGLSGELWHADCARPLWDSSAETLRRWGLADRT
ncbi:hypothetical protein [Caulobacter sp. Root1455]|uniref:hypothetical protein n=1 Tax=Caulobacter sp. Root1455 TaxID=1736465 RepID=UPI0012E3D24C|nr:hypothetical protein [Caulobacter sp. Root1455]